MGVVQEVDDKGLQVLFAASIARHLSYLVLGQSECSIDVTLNLFLHLVDVFHSFQLNPDHSAAHVFSLVHVVQGVSRHT